MRAGRGCGWRKLLSQRRVRNCVADWISSSSVEQSACLLELLATSGTPDTVVPDFGTAARQRVLQEAANKLHARELQAAQLLAAIVTITKGDFASSIFSKRLLLMATRKM
jgi:hypothetical protein